jgi:adenine-specific DNA glycosylase
LQFQLLVVCIFLNKTKGDHAIPASRRLLSQYPKPEILANACYDDIKIFFQNIGLIRRARWLIQLSKEWLINPPQAGKIRKKLRNGSIQFESEVAHLHGVGPYANDAWRIFCKDKMYEKAGIKVLGSEWKTVKPKDKELRSYLT